MSEHHRQRSWANRAAKARDTISRQLPLPCVECGRPVLPEDKWDVGHIIPLSLGGDVTQYGASHRACNRRAGGQMGAAIINRRKKVQREW